ncbi:ATP-dependent endonuclease [Rhodococcus sp. NPDC059968]|uniref:ATP-dependent nuclease n=1 Tax=Rhodococcus sp. NPDC059968 TaxID=3347017 RepID=UPI00366B55D0
MIEKVRISGYRKFRDLMFEPHPRFNILVGENEAGKSTLLEAIGLALTGRVNGRAAAEELNPFWFNQENVDEFFRDRQAGIPVAPPEIRIEIFLLDREEFQRSLFGAHNSDTPTRECAGVCLRVVPNPEYSVEIEAHLDSDSSILPVEYYKVEWCSFGDIVLTARPKELTTAIIDSRTIRSSNGVDFHLRQILNGHLAPEEKAAVSLAFRSVKEKMTADHLQDVNSKMAQLEGALDDKQLSLAMDQSARGSWDTSVVPHVAKLPFAMAGQGQQAAIKIALAMGNEASSARVVMIEEPENHLSHTSLNMLLRRVEDLAGGDQQLFVTTHSSFVLNRLGIDGLMFISNGHTASMKELTPETVAYFKKLPGYDTLRMVLAQRFVLVEGPSDEILFERFYKDDQGRRPIEDGIDVISMRGLSLQRCLELANALVKRCAALRDNDGIEPAELTAGLDDWTDDVARRVFIGDVSLGKTLEPQLLSANPDEQQMRRVLGVTDRADLLTWMTNSKTEAALRIAQTEEKLAAPKYFTEAIEFISGR